MNDEYTRNILRPDNYELFDIVRDRLNHRPIEPIESIAYDIGVSVDDLCRWVIGFREAGRPSAPYQSPKFAAIGPSRSTSTDLWADGESKRRQRFAQKARDGARAARLAMEESH
jgi:hypothetical protein